MNKRKLFERARNNPRDLRFSDLLLLVEACGFRLDRIRGSHRIYEHPSLPVGLNLQPDKHGKAKEYQVVQVLRTIATYGLQIEEDGR